VTEVKGLEKFGVKLPDAAKSFAKKFSCGASVIKEAEGNVIDVQGDFQEDLKDFLIENFKIPEDDIIFEDGKSKSKK